MERWACLTDAGIVWAREEQSVTGRERGWQHRRKQKRLDERITGLRNDLERARHGQSDDAPKLAKVR